MVIIRDLAVCPYREKGWIFLSGFSQIPLLCISRFGGISHFSSSLAGEERGGGRGGWKERRRNPNQLYVQFVNNFLGLNLG